MGSKTSFFNRQIYLKTLSRFWPLWGAYTLVLFIIIPLPLMNTNYTGAVQPDTIISAASQILSTGWNAGCIISFVMAAATAMCVFGFLYNQRHTGMIASLPVRRETVYTSAFLAGFTAMAAADVLIFLITLLTELCTGLLSAGYLWQWLGIMLMMNLTFYGFAALCAMLTGNLVVMPLVYAVLSFTVYAVEYLVRALLETFVFGMTLNGGTLTFLSPVIELMTNQPASQQLSSSAAVQGVYAASMTPELWTLLGCYCASGIVFAVVGLLLYRARRMETSTDVVAIRVLRPVFKYCMAFGCALVLGMLLYSIVFTSAYRADAAYILIAFMLCGAFIGYFSADMLMKKTFHVFSGNWKGYIISCVVIIALMLCCSCDVFGYERRVPDAADVSSVTLNINGETMELRQTDNISQTIELQKSIIADKAVHNNASVTFTTFNISYNLKNGKIIQRRYNVSSAADQTESQSSDIARLQKLLNVQEAINYRKATTVPVTAANISYTVISFFDPQSNAYFDYTVNPDDAEKLYNDCILPDIRSGALGRVWLYNDSDFNSKVYALTINMNLYDTSDGSNQDNGFNKGSYGYFSTTLTTDAVNTLAWLKANTDIEPVLEKDVPHDGNIVYGGPATEVQPATVTDVAG